MSSIQEQPTNDSSTRRIKFKGSDDVYEFSLLPTRKARQVLTNFLSIALPVLTASYEKFGDYTTQLQEIKTLEAGGQGLEPEVDFFDLSVLLSQQIIKPEFETVLDGLIDNLKKNGNAISVDDAFVGNLGNYLKIVEYAFKENLMLPLAQYLEEKGLSGMLTSLRVVMNGAKEVMKK